VGAGVRAPAGLFLHGAPSQLTSLPYRSCLNVPPSGLQIFVKMMKTVMLDVNSTDTLDQIKSQISTIEGIDKNQQMLFFAGSHLEDHNRLADYVMTNSYVDLYVTDGIQIPAQENNRYMVYIIIYPPSDTHAFNAAQTTLHILR
jgi:hypothetical protein